MTLTESVKTCLSKYATFSGRASRSEYWKFWLFWLIVQLFFILVNTAIFGPTVEVGQRVSVAADGTQTISPFQKTSYNSGVFGTVFWLAILVPGLAVASRRLHDTGRSGWWQIMPFALSLVSFTTLIVAAVGWAAFVKGFTTPGGATVQNPSGLGMAFAVSLSAFVVLLFWLCKKSQPGPNKYGPNPTEVTP
ncbi:DUF805 domain-containing protein [uncultured Roseobacter sp.]|uniref:DUF805 domain-containing protein n=1 Tax=uncultured Roseobacter sp. TaxID=114847 RepID=UPI00261148C8|nr:DUF805 domain-containing protein [uncultured Roseobacter sp.]